jgi:hypothetical protein
MDIRSEIEMQNYADLRQPKKKPRWCGLVQVFTTFTAPDPNDLGTSIQKLFTRR